jgi:hypothetical protein
MLAVRLLALDERLGFIQADDVCFGRQVEAIEGVFAAESVAAMATIAFLPRLPRFATWLGLGWCGAMLAESLSDVVTFGDDPRLMAEELAFVAIYVYLLALLSVYREQTRSENVRACCAPLTPGPCPRIGPS